MNQEKEQSFKESFGCIQGIRRKSEPHKPTDEQARHREAMLRLEMAQERRDLDYSEVWA